MIRPGPGVAFTWSDDGDMRPAGSEDRVRVSTSLGIGTEWATLRQVHGSTAVRVDTPGAAGDGDALVTDVPGLATAIFTADCIGVVLTGPGGVAVAHAGWRGLAAGVIESALGALAEIGKPADAAYLGPAIGPCCFEVGDEVADRFGEDRSKTTWGTVSVDLISNARRRLSPLSVWADGRCTACGGGYSHRADATAHRMAAIGWVA